MIKCPVCRYENPDDATVCLNCGAPVERGRMSEPIDDISEEQTLLMSPPPSSDEPRGHAGPPPHRQSHGAAAGAGGTPPPAQGPGSGSGAQLPPLGAGPTEPPEGVNIYLILSIVLLCLTFFLSVTQPCCFPVMVAPIIALIFAILAMSASNRGDFAGAHSQLKIAKVALLVTGILFLVALIAVGLLMVLGVAIFGGMMAAG